MAEPLKNLLHPALVKTMAGHIAAHSTGFELCGPSSQSQWQPCAEGVEMEEPRACPR
ncbi:hypothetical protein [Pararhizobium sp. DWP1-1-3]|uniref:hypothetical protein n=1 Tax=Pararhizobium sp. DWP1-1-3 TaxID=2804652 RepID=UPI003CF9D809